LVLEQFLERNFPFGTLLRSLARLAAGCGKSGSLRASTCRPSGEVLEPKTLLSTTIGWNGGIGGTQNSMITPANVARLTQQYSYMVDGQIVAEPLAATVDVTIGPNPGVQAVVFVATQRDSLYAFNDATGQLDWHLSFLDSSAAGLPQSELDFQGSGIIGTPVIDPASNTVYLVSSECYVAGGLVHYTKALRAIDMSDGTERPTSPAVIADTAANGLTPISLTGPSVRGFGADSINGRVTFDVLRQMQRPGLAIDGNDIVIGFGSALGVVPYYHGWILAFDKSSLQTTGVFNVTPNGHNGGIWNDGNPIQVDSYGYLYTATGNGTFDARLNRRGFPSRGDFGDSVLKLRLVPGYHGPNGTGIKVVDYFTPHNQAKLDKYDEDLASSGVLVLPDRAGGPRHPNVVLASGKLGTLYVINRNNMGRFRSESDHVVAEMPHAITSSFDTPARFLNNIYYAGAADILRSFALIKGRLVQTGESTNAFPLHGASPVVSSDGAANGIVWLISSTHNVYAYDATHVNRLLWSARLPGYSTFSIPCVTDDGHVIVGAGRNLVVYALAQPD
jgi:outer membrane protein assembly factor BamB